MRHAGRAEPHSRDHVNAGPTRTNNAAAMRSSLDLKLGGPSDDVTQQPDTTYTTGLLNSEPQEPSNDTTVDPEHKENSNDTIESQPPCSNSIAEVRSFLDQTSLDDPVELTVTFDLTKQKLTEPATAMPETNLVDSHPEKILDTPELKENLDASARTEVEGKIEPSAENIENGVKPSESRPKYTVRKPPGNLNFTKTDLDACPRIIPLPPPPSIRLEGLGGMDSGTGGVRDVSGEAGDSSPDSDIYGEYLKS